MEHELSILSPDTVVQLRADASRAEKLGQLTEGQIDIIRRSKWFHIFIPSHSGGLQLSLPDAVRLEEDLAYADGSVGWVVTLCGGAGMFTGYMEAGAALDVLAVKDFCIAGSGGVNGRAVKLEGGYVVTGSWPYSSGAPHATHFTGNCIVERDGKELRTINGDPLVHSFLFKRGEVILEHNWDYLGLRATAGHRYSVDNLVLPASRSFNIGDVVPSAAYALHRYPFLQLAESTLSANVSGMCRHFIELAEETLTNPTNAGGPDRKTDLRKEKIKERGMDMVFSAREDIRRLRKVFYHRLCDSWAELESQGKLSADACRLVSNSSLELVSGARNWVNRIYPYCGLSAARMGTPINQVWRNLHTAAQHSLLLQ